MEPVTKEYKWLRKLGLLFIVISLTLRFIPQLLGLVETETWKGSDVPIFLVIAALNVVYLFMYLALAIQRDRFRFRNYGHREFIFAVVLLSIGCFSVNEAVMLFSPTVPWLTWMLGLSYTALVCYAYFDELPRWLKIPVYTLLGTGALVTAMYMVILAPLLPIATLLIVFFGIGLYLFAPLFSLTMFIGAILKEGKEYLKFSIAGFAVPLIAAVIFLFGWKQVDIKVTNLIVENKSEMPDWLYLDMHLEEDWMTQYYLLGDVKYSADGIMRSRRFNRSSAQLFDPLVELSDLVSDNKILNHEERLKLLEGRYDFRHMRQRRLWGGNKLVTTLVDTDIQVWPEYRIAYVDQEIVIHYDAREKGWGSSTQEGIYTFYLPDGAVASSLSLWIDGKEEFSGLTTKSKADSAYATIVGVERRDPALLHWQEGNTLVVTVFPCTAAEDRRFSLGITVPLKYDGTQLELPYIAFNGPYLKGTNEVTTIRHGNGGKLAVMDAPMRFSEKDDRYVYNGPFKGEWDLKLAPVPLATQGFSFNGHSYTLKPQEETFKPFKPTYVGLDLNESWTPAEISQMAKTFEGHQIFVPLRGKLVEFSVAKNDKHFEQEMSRRYSLFPFAEMEEPSKWLVITKTNSPGILPNLLSDIEPDLDTLKLFTVNNGGINMLDIGTENSLYLNTYNQFGVLNYHRADVGQIGEWFTKGSFPAYNNNPAEIDLPISQMTIVEDTAALVNANAPDHLMRLFAYNKVLHDIGGKYFQKLYVEDEYVALAELAHVVTPVSSMVVLETVKDYERFNIEESKNSLKNAGDKSAGAVPEPHEWALIILSLVMMGWLYMRRRKQNLVA